jgi:RecA/RadA recombinase
MAMADKTYTARVKRVWHNQQGRRKVLLSAEGVGDAWIGWNKTPKDMDFNPGDTVKVKLQKHDDGRWMTTEVVGQPATQKSKKKEQQKTKKKEQQKTISLAKRLKNMLRGPQGYLRKMYLLALGGKGIDMKALDARTQSLGPFIEYVELSKQSQDHLRKRARFVWEIVEDQKRIRVSDRQAIDIRVRRLHLPYCLAADDTTNLSPGTKLMNLKKGITTAVRTVRTTPFGLEFSTERDLQEQDGWLIFDESQAPLTWGPNLKASEFQQVKINGEVHEIKHQEKASDDWQHLVLEHSNPKTVQEEDNLEIDGLKFSTYDWELVSKGNAFGPMKDDVRQITNVVQLNQDVLVESLPSGKHLYDPHGVKYSFRETTKSSNDTTLKVALHPEVEEQLDDEKDVNPLDVLFSPDTDFRELGLHGHDEQGRFVAGGVLSGKRKDGSTYQTKMTTLRIKQKDIERQTITVDQVPPNEDSILTLKPNTRYLERQRDMLMMLRDRPLFHHDGLLKLTEVGTENQRESLWPGFTLHEIANEDWEVLKQRDDETLYDGTEEQREFVRTALSTPDYAILQGPPGSGKTTAIIELIAQCAKQGKRVLLCGSTQASIDNVLTRIMAKSHLARLISPLRIGWKDGIYDENVHSLVLSEQQEQYQRMGFSEEEATDLILRQSNLTCGTMQGILNHPWISEDRSNSGRLMKDPQPQWDVLIIDEASKTTFQQFIIPAAFSKRWILVGDVRQLPPFLETSELMTNLDQMKDDEGKPFTPAAQRACLLLRQLSYVPQSPKIPIVLVEPNEVPSFIAKELEARDQQDRPQLDITLIGSKRLDTGTFQVSIPSDYTEEEHHLSLLGSEIIIIGSDAYHRMAESLPPYVVFRPGRYELNAISKSRTNRLNALPDYDAYRGPASLGTEELNHDWSHEVSWRLNRAYELKVSKNKEARDKWESQINQLLPVSQNVEQRIEEVRSIALPSVLECLQDGFAEGRGKELLPETTLTRGFPQMAKNLRFKKISFQHRMHGEISAFSRSEFYDGDALIDADTIGVRNRRFPFGFRAEKSRSTWLDVPSTINSGKNDDEVKAIKTVLQDFISWARFNTPDHQANRDEPHCWEVALLSPYQAQRRGLRDMVRQLTGLQFETRFDLRQMNPPTNVALTVNSSDRFQGQEADIVVLSMRNGSRIGFLDSPNRMNVATTRAREWRLVVGNYDYFSGEQSGRRGKCQDRMLIAFAKAHDKVSMKELNQ